MSLKKLQCENCGAKLEADFQQKTGVCPNCGTPYTFSEDINVVNNETRIGAVGVLNANSITMVDEKGSQGKLANAEAYMKFGEFDNAENEFRQVTNIAPGNINGWYGIIRARSHEFSNDLCENELDMLDEYARKILVLPDDGTRDVYYRKWENYKSEQRRKNADTINLLNSENEKLTSQINELSDQKDSLLNQLDKTSKEHHILSGKINLKEKQIKTLSESESKNWWFYILLSILASLGFFAFVVFALSGIIDFLFLNKTYGIIFKTARAITVVGVVSLVLMPFCGPIYNSIVRKKIVPMRKEINPLVQDLQSIENNQAYLNGELNDVQSRIDDITAAKKNNESRINHIINSNAPSETQENKGGYKSIVEIIKEIERI